MTIRTPLLAVLLVCAAAPALAVPTEITVRVMSKDAKFVGTAMGGAEILITDYETKDVLARGVTAGGTGSTPKIMTNGKARRDALSDADAAKFTATIDLQQPRRITVTAMGPMNPKEAAMTVTSTQWVVPGKPISGGDGWVLELPGFAVSLVDAPAQELTREAAAKLRLTAKVTMMCGCPIEPGGMWDASKFEVAALVQRAGETARTVKFDYAGQLSTFAGALSLAPGDYTVDVYAYDPANGNTGVSHRTFHVK
jgi:hypothetical protein